MRHSIYLTLATLLIKADLKREEREWQRTVRRSLMMFHGPMFIY